MTGPRVIPADLTAAGICRDAARRWWRRHDLNWRDFLQHGIAAEDLRATGDGVVERPIAAAIARTGQGG
jgi:hypothetical protein